MEFFFRHFNKAEDKGVVSVYFAAVTQYHRLGSL